MDYFLLIETLTFTLTNSIDRFQCQSFYTVMHGVGLYYLTDCVNRAFANRYFGFWRLYRLPIEAQLYWYVMHETPDFDRISVEVLRSQQRARLSL